MTIIPFNENEKVFDNRSGVYAIINIIMNKFYIGSAVKLRNRKSEHLSDLRTRTHHNQYLQNSYNKYGEKVFIFIVLEYVEDKTLLVDIEDVWIKKYESIGVLYNIRKKASSNLGLKHSDETKKKISLVKRNISDETRKKMSDSQKRKIVSEETKKKISLSKKGKKRKIFSDETRKKMSLARKGKKSNLDNKSKLRKSVIQLDKNNNILNIFESMIEAAKSTGVNNSHISRCCLGKLKSAGGFVWHFV